MRWVGVASDGDAAVTAVAQHRPDVVLMDLQMPTVSGIDATAAVLAEFPEVAVVMLEGGRIEVPVGNDGHYRLTARVNDIPIRFVIDTGASSIAPSRPMAPEAPARRIRMSTPSVSNHLL